MKKLFAIILVGLLLPTFSFAILTYERNPSDFTFRSPVEISVSVDNFDEIDVYVWPEVMNYWTIFVYKTSWEDLYYDPILVASTTLSHTFTIDLPVGSYISVDAMVCPNSTFEGRNPPCEYGVFLEYDEDNPIFEITGPLFELPITSVGSTTGILNDLLNDIGPFIWLFIGIPLGFVVVKRIIKIIPR